MWICVVWHSPISTPCYRTLGPNTPVLQAPVSWENLWLRPECRQGRSQELRGPFPFSQWLPHTSTSGALSKEALELLCCQSFRCQFLIKEKLPHCSFCFSPTLFPQPTAKGVALLHMERDQRAWCERAAPTCCFLLSPMSRSAVSVFSSSMLVRNWKLQECLGITGAGNGKKSVQSTLTQLKKPCQGTPSSLVISWSPQGMCQVNEPAHSFT